CLCCTYGIQHLWYSTPMVLNTYGTQHLWYSTPMVFNTYGIQERYSRGIQAYGGKITAMLLTIQYTCPVDQSVANCPDCRRINRLDRSAGSARSRQSS